MRRMILSVLSIVGIAGIVLASDPWSFREGRGVLLNEKAKASLGIDIQYIDDASMIPVSALVETVRGDFVYLTNGDAFLRVPVEIGSRHDDEVEVVDGLFEGDELVVSGAYDLWVVELQAVNGGRGCADGH